LLQNFLAQCGALFKVMRLNEFWFLRAQYKTYRAARSWNGNKSVLLKMAHSVKQRHAV
jgi:hypothetical protein